MASEPSELSTPSPKTPNKYSSCFSPIVLPSSPAELVNQKNITGLPRVLRDIAADLYNNIQKWNNKHITGATIVQQIAILKRDSNDQLPVELEPLINQLLEVVQNMQIVCNCLSELGKQAASLKRLQNDCEPLFNLLTIDEMAQIVGDIVKSYENELKAKEYILENISFSRTKDEVMFFSAYWVHQIHVNDNINFKLEQILTESGHRRIV